MKVLQHNDKWFKYNFPEKEDYEFNLVPDIMIGKDECSYNGRRNYIGCCWLFWSIFYYYK